MLRGDVTQTIPLAEMSLRRALDPGAADPRAPELYLESLGIDEHEKRGVVELAARGAGAVDPVVSFLVGATSGYLYREFIGNLRSYPIPDIRLEEGRGRTLLDVGCSWGRWSIAAARKGYDAVGIDPSLGAVMAARRAARALGMNTRYVVGDARFLPFRDACFDAVFSYSVLQHMAQDDVRLALAQVARVLKPGGLSKIQMASAFGVRSLYHLARRRFRPPRSFDVRYWRPAELRREFGRLIGASSLSADCFFGLGLQSADAAMMGGAKRFILRVSDGLVGVSRTLRPLALLADSLYIESRRQPTP
jgi:SAM-dependent methyltransferase